MFKKSFLFVLFVGLILVGCTDDQSEKRINESEKMEQPENQNERTVIPSLQLHIGNNNVGVVRGSFCWDKGDCSLKFVHPKDLEYSPNKNIIVKPGQTISLIFAGDSQNNPKVILPDTIEVTQYHGDDEQRFEVDRQIKAPSEKGVYYYHIHVIWSDKIEGEAYYGAKIRVR